MGSNISASAGQTSRKMGCARRQGRQPLRAVFSQGKVICMIMRKGDIGAYTEEIFTQPFEDTREEQIDAALRNEKVSHYRVKTIISGPMVESEIYPVYRRRGDTPKRPKKKKSDAAQKNLNAKNAKKKFCRLVNTNFTKGDILVTVTYDNEHRPADEDAAHKSLTKYIRRLQSYAKRRGWPQLKYLYVTEYNESDSPKGRIRVHHHIICNFPDRDVAENLWKEGGRTNTKRLQPDSDFNLQGLAMYLVKDPKGKKRWGGSLNLKKPKVYIADRKFRSVKQVEQMLNFEGAVYRLGKLYPSFKLVEEPQVYVNDTYGGYYIYTRLRKKE